MTTAAEYARTHGWRVGSTLRHTASGDQATVTAIGLHEVLIFDGDMEWAASYPALWSRVDVPYGGLA